MWSSISLWLWFAFPWWPMMVNIFSWTCWPFICHFWKNAYSFFPFIHPFFNQNVWVFFYWVVWVNVHFLKRNLYLNFWQGFLKKHIYLSDIFLFFSFFICSEFCHTLEWNSHGFTCVPYPDPPSKLPLHPLPLGFPSAPGPSTCLMHPTWAGDLFHPRYYTCFDAFLLKHPTLSFSHRV